MQMRRLLVLCLCWQACWAGAQAPLAGTPPTYSVPELVRTVLAFNPALNQAQLGQAQAQAALQTAQALPNPRLEWSGGRAQAPVSSAQGAVSSWGASQLLENPQVREARSAIAREGIAYQKVQVLLTQREVIAHVRQLAYEVVFARKRCRRPARA